MYRLLYNVFFALKRLERRVGKHGFSKFCRKYYDSFDIYLNVVFRKFIIRFPLRKSGITKKKRNRKVIVSLTSFPARIETVWLTIETIFRQSVKADEVILWLAESQFDGLDSLPENLKRMCNRGLTIRFCDDLRSHKKYYYSFQEYQNDLVITMDDDIFYPKDKIKKLLKMHKRYPDDVISSTAQGVPENLAEAPSHWFSLKQQVISSTNAQPFTGTGVLFQPKLYKDILYDKSLIKNLAPTVDDLWLYIVGYISGIKVTTIPKYLCFDQAVWGTAENSLFHINGKQGGNQNDILWKEIFANFSDSIAHK